MIRRRTTRWLLVLCVGLTTTLASAKKPPAAAKQATLPTLAAIQRAQDRLRPLAEKLGKAEPGDWLAAHKEAGQSFDQFRRQRPERQPRARRVIYIQPIGEFTTGGQRLVASTVDLLSRFYDAPVKTLPTIAADAIPAAARREHPVSGDKQWLAPYLLERVLQPRRPQDATAVLGLTATDLWPGEGWNFVFGQASLTERVGVWSIARNGNPDDPEVYPLCLGRTLRVAVHETGHMFGMQHCTAYRCGMNGSNSLQESDRQPLAFCPECAAKIWWACQSDPIERFTALEQFAVDHGLDDEARHWRRALQALGE